MARGAEIELFERDLILEIRGSKLVRRRAKKYCKGVMDQRTGPVNVTQDGTSSSHLSTMITSKLHHII